jgi:hypothetical protein
VNLPTPDEFTKERGYNPFPPRWKRWLSAAREAILSAQPTAGRHVSVDEHPGKGTVINIDDTSARRPGGGGGIPATGACCLDGDCTITTEADCGGIYQGDGTTCDDVDCGNATSGACCVGTDCSITTPADCETSGGTYQGDDTLCDPNPCEIPSCNGCGFDAFDGSGRKFLTKTDHITRTAHSDIVSGSDGCNFSADITQVTTLSTADCSASVTCSGTMHYENAAHPDLEFADCDYESDGAGGCHLVLTDSAGGIGCSLTGCADGHCGGGCTPSTVSATEQSCSCDFSDLHNSAHAERTITLSNECTLSFGDSAFDSFWPIK